MAHTPGPWSARPDSGQIVLNGANIYAVQEICNEQGGFNPDDIRLMAAAPDLLEALRNLENDDGSIPNPIWRLVKAAIAKAEGRAKA